jgi:hypothetical protein
MDAQPLLPPADLRYRQADFTYDTKIIEREQPRRASTPRRNIDTQGAN